jgi:hypothetical protein
MKEIERAELNRVIVNHLTGMGRRAAFEKLHKEMDKRIAEDPTFWDLEIVTPETIDNSSWTTE